MKKVKVAIIGAMHDHAAAAVESVRRLSDVFDLVGYAVPEGERITVEEAFLGVPRMSVEEALSTPGLEAAVIETSELNLTEYAMAAAKRGLAIHMDKPGGIDPVRFRELISLVREKRLVFHTGYMYRYNPAIKKLIAEIRAGKLGEIYSVEAQMNCFHTPEKRQWLGQFPGGMNFYLGCHLVDLVLQIQGEPSEVIPLNCSTGINGVTAEDFGMAVLRYPRGYSFVKTAAIEAGGFLRRQLVVCGSLGTVEVRPLEKYIGENGDQFAGVREVTENIADWTYDGVREKTAPENRYDGMFRAFAEYVRGERENPYSYDYEEMVYRTVLRCCGVSSSM